MNTIKESAMKFLLANPLLHMGMIEPIRRGTADVLYAEHDGVFFKETKSGAYMMSVESCHLGNKLLRGIPHEGLFTFHQEFMVEAFKNVINHKNFLENFQAVYEKKDELNFSNIIDIQMLNMNHFQIIIENYDLDVGENYIINRLKSGNIFGAYFGTTLVGFAGIHEEGSIGLLKIFNRHRRLGYGAILTGFLVNLQLKRHLVPFEQINVTNVASLGLATKLGFSISKQKAYWIF